MAKFRMYDGCVWLRIVVCDGCVCDCVIFTHTAIRLILAYAPCVKIAQMINYTTGIEKTQHGQRKWPKIECLVVG